MKDYQGRKWHSFLELVIQQEIIFTKQEYLYEEWRNQDKFTTAAETFHTKYRFCLKGRVIIEQMSLQNSWQ